MGMSPKLLVIALSGLVSAVGLVVLVAPLTLLEFGRSLLTPFSLYVIATVRVAFGGLLLWVASTSRMPRTLRVIGAVVVLSGVLTPLLGVESAHAMLEWWASQGQLIMRLWAVFPIAIGVFLIYTVANSDRADA